jgi:hypothetical protein
MLFDKLFKHGNLIFTLLLIGLYACSGDEEANPVVGANGDTGAGGFGVSGLLFENNLIMWSRDSDGNRSELFPQMYFTRADVKDFPVWGTFPEAQMVSGGVPRDGIPALVNPRFVAANSPEAGYLRDSDLVLGVDLNGEVKAYPENILWWHEIANDVAGGEQVIMSLCPLTGTGLFFRAPDDPGNVDKLILLPVVETTWKRWREMYPQTLVISDNTGFNRNYTSYPYGGYRQENTLPLFGLRTGQIDGRFPPKHTVLGILHNGTQKAYPFASLSANRVINDSFNGLDLLVVSDIDGRLAIPYERVVNGQVLTFEAGGSSPFQMSDEQTGSLWNIKGEAVSGSLQGAKLQQIPAYNAFWFAWAQFWPGTQVFQ